MPFVGPRRIAGQTHMGGRRGAPYSGEDVVGAIE